MNNQTDIIGSFAKGLRILEAFGANTVSLTISQAAEHTDLDRATARRCLLTLHHEGYADYNGKHFSLTHKALRLGMGALSSMPLSQIVQPWLDQLTGQIDQSCSVAVRDDNEIVYIARAAQKKVMSIGLMPGSRLSVHNTSMGRVLLSVLDDVTAMELVKSCDLTPNTQHSLTDPDEIIDEIRRVRSQGFAAAAGIAY